MTTYRELDTSECIISLKELKKFYSKINNNAVKLYKACEKNSVLSELFSQDRSIMVKAIFTFHPYRTKERWLLYKTEYLLPSCLLDPVKSYQFQNNYPNWYSYFNGNLKGDVSSDFNNISILPNLVIDMHLNVELKEIFVKEGNLFEKPSTAMSWSIENLHTFIEFDLGNHYLGNKWLNFKSKYFNHIMQVDPVTKYVDVHKPYEQFYTAERMVIRPDDDFTIETLEEHVNELIKNNLFVMQFNK